MLSVGNDVETVVLLHGEKVDGYVDVDLDVEKLEGKSGIATYAEIKTWIEEKYGFKVSTLYIAQIKDKAVLRRGRTIILDQGKVKFLSVLLIRKRQSWMPSDISI